MKVQQKRWTCIKSICKKWKKENILNRSKSRFQRNEKYRFVDILTQGFEKFRIK